ncbi:hypothetical protein BU17DRAFT_92983 [Hysterangium stoloniferum]|nr:hypothetical protein BU17DRAFT_92983 [Hysterangium stoloniferum]
MSVLISRSPVVPQRAPLVDLVDIHEFADLQSAATSFVELVASRPRRAIRLHCTVPTWSSSSEFCTDLHDLNELRSRSLVFVHDLCEKLGSAGIQASYRLVPSDTPLVLLRALPEDSPCSCDESDALNLAKHGSGRKKAILTAIDGIPSIILT